MTHKSQQIQILDIYSLTLTQNGLISLSQELIEYAYDSMTEVNKLAKIISIHCEGSSLWLVTADGFFILLLDHKVRLVQRFCIEAVETASVVRF